MYISGQYFIIMFFLGQSYDMTRISFSALSIYTWAAGRIGTDMILKLPVRCSESPAFCRKYDLFRTQFALLFLPAFVCGCQGQLPGFSGQNLSSGFCVFYLYLLAVWLLWIPDVFPLFFLMLEWKKRRIRPFFSWNRLFAWMVSLILTYSAAECCAARRIRTEKERQIYSCFLYSFYAICSILLNVLVYSIYPSHVYYSLSHISCGLSCRFVYTDSCLPVDPHIFVGSGIRFSELVSGI